MPRASMVHSADVQRESFPTRKNTSTTQNSLLCSACGRACTGISNPSWVPPSCPGLKKKSQGIESSTHFAKLSSFMVNLRMFKPATQREHSTCVGTNHPTCQRSACHAIVHYCVNHQQHSPRRILTKILSREPSLQAGQRSWFLLCYFIKRTGNISSMS